MAGSWARTFFSWHCRNKRLRAKTEFLCCPKAQSADAGPCPATAAPVCWVEPGGLLRPLSCGASQHYQESILAVCEGFSFHSGCAQAAAAQVPGGSCSAECSYTGQVLLPESHFLPSPLPLITARLKLWTGFLN